MKLKTHKGLAKRIKKTKAGAILRRSAYISHLLRKKSAGRRRSHSGLKNVSGANKKQIKKLIPY